MSEDNLYLVSCYLIQVITMILWIVKSKNKKRSANINISVFLAYNLIFHYNLNYNSSGGVGLVWFVYLMLSLGIHWIINFIGIIRTFVVK